MTSKNIIFTALTLALLGAGVIGVSSVNAQTNTNWHQNLIAKLATKFNVSESEVQTVFDENRKEHQTQMTKTLSEKLTQSVKDGKITENQKQAILNFHAKMQQARDADRTNWQNLTVEQRKTQMETRRTEMEFWAKDNGIDLTTLRDLLGGFGPKGQGRGRGMGMGRF